MIEPAPFAPPENGLLTEDQVRRFLRAHETMAKVNEIYLDSLAGALPAAALPVSRPWTSPGTRSPASSASTAMPSTAGFSRTRRAIPANVRILEQMNVTTVTR